MFALPVLLALFFSVGHVLLMRHPRACADVIRIILRYVFLFMVGFSGLVAFAGHIFFSEEVAKQIDWPSGSPFQSEVAAANLAFAVLGICSFRLGTQSWLATALGYAVFMEGAGVVHIRDLLLHGNAAPLNSGAIILITDLVFPALLLMVVFIIHLWPRKASG
jgi:Family of unknown function (DUF6790)